MKSPGQLRLAERKLQEIMRLMDKGDVDAINKILDRADADPASWPGAEGIRYVHARLEEEGAFSGDNNAAALKAFSTLSSQKGEFQSEGLVGQARLLYRLNEEENANRILELCKEAVDIDRNVRAMMVIGHVLQNTKNDFPAANRWYLRAFRRGMPWGLRFYASLQAEQRKFVRSSLAYAIATITHPILLLLFGARGPYK